MSVTISKKKEDIINRDLKKEKKNAQSIQDRKYRNVSTRSIYKTESRVRDEPPVENEPISLSSMRYKSIESTSHVRRSFRDLTIRLTRILSRQRFRWENSQVSLSVDQSEAAGYAGGRNEREGERKYGVNHVRGHAREINRTR